MLCSVNSTYLGQLSFLYQAKELNNPLKGFSFFRTLSKSRIPSPYFMQFSAEIRFHLSQKWNRNLFSLKI